METVTKIKNQKPKEIPIDKILYSHGIEEYSLSYLSRQPIVLIKYKNKYLVGDGNHRLSAARLKKQKSIKAFILTSKNIDRIIAHRNAYIAGWLVNIVEGLETFDDLKKTIIKSTQEYYKSKGYIWKELFNDTI